MIDIRRGPAATPNNIAHRFTCQACKVAELLAGRWGKVPPPPPVVLLVTDYNLLKPYRLKSSLVRELCLCLCALSAGCLTLTDPQLYYLAFLRPNPARKVLPKEETDRIQTAHMANIRRMADQGVLVAAGPFDDQPHTISGLFLFRTSSLAEAKRIAAEDPTVLENRNTVDVHTWGGPPGIGEEYKRLHKVHPDTPEGMGVQPLFLLSRGTKWIEDAPGMKLHSDYLQRLQRQHKVGMWGPTKDDASFDAVVVFERIGDDEAKSLMAKDPAVQAELFQVEFHHWWCAEHVIPK